MRLSKGITGFQQKPRSSHSDAAIRYWNSKTYGEVIFNGYD
jgi:hypothetical protein